MILKTELKQHQVQAVDKLSKIKIGALYMEMGTGKTRTALELINQRLEAGKIDYILWLCPCSVKSTIKNEIEKHIENGIENFRIEGIESLSSSIRLNAELLELVKNKNVYLIVDESNLVKNHKAQRTINIEKLAEHCKYKLILNGTPISKCEKDLFAQWYILDWRILGYQSFWSFAANHLEYDERIPGRINRVLNIDYLVRKIAPYTYQVKKEECLQLPEKYYKKSGSSLTDEQRDHYEYITDTFLMNVDEMKPSTIYRLFTACQHVVSGNRIISKQESSIKTEPLFTPQDNPRILDLLNYAINENEEKTIIWCKYTREIKDINYVLTDKYGKSAVVSFYGELSKKERVANIEKFKKSARFFIANKTCAGYGLNLQFCSNMIYYSNDWDWATRAQSEDRVHRMGQENTVTITDMFAHGTLDERILKCLEKKERLVDIFKSQLKNKKDKYELRKWIDGSEIGGEDIQQQKCI
jgi:SNF2 family DNA or RNA helicase